MLGLSTAGEEVAMSAVLIVLVLIIAVAELAPRNRLVDVAMALLVNLLSSQLSRLSPLAARRLLRVALVALPPSERGDQFDEWVDHLSTAGDDGVRALLLVFSLIVRALPRLVCRSRLRQGFDALFPVREAQIYVRDATFSRFGLWPRDASDECAIYLFYMATRRPAVAGRWLSVKVIYMVSLVRGELPEISRTSWGNSKSLPRPLERFVERMGYDATDRSFAETEVIDRKNQRGQRMSRAEISAILGAKHAHDLGDRSVQL
jgi:hypothetical protein